MGFSIGLRRAFALVSLLFVPFACGGGAKVDGEGSGGGGGGDDSACRELFGKACGRACDDDTPCEDGMHCRADKCHAECGEGFPCSGGRTCSSSGECLGLNPAPPDECEPQTCAEAGFACGMMVDECGNVVDCAEEGLTCAANEVCSGNPTECKEASGFADCEVCSHIPDCSDEDQVTVLRGRVVSPGRDDDDTANQVGIPNAVVYLLRTTDVGDLPAIPRGLPDGDGQSCDRCDDQEFGPLLVGAVSDASGYFELEEYVPVDTELLLVVKAGKFRRAAKITVPASDACKTSELPTALPGNPARLPRDLDDGLAVNIPHMAVSTGRIDAMECVFHKMGLSADVFGGPGTDKPVHIYHGASSSDRPAGGAWPADDTSASCAACDACSNGTGSNACRAEHCGGGSQADKFAFLSENCVARSCRSCSACGTGNTTSAQNCRAANCGGSSTAARNDFLDSQCRPYLDTRFLEDASVIGSYDMVVLDCQGTGYDSNGQRRDAHGDHVRHYVNRGGRMFASHLAHTWLYANGEAPYSESDPLSTGLADTASWEPTYSSTPSSGTGQVTLPDYWEDGASDWTPENASPRIESFAEWLDSEGITGADQDHKFSLTDPRSMCIEPGEHTEVFVDGVDSMNAIANRVQQFSFNTPYGAPEAAACGRVAYSGFHVVAGGGGSNPFEHVLFPEHCDGDLSDQEKVLLYMLFDLGACVGSEPPMIPCVPATCPSDACGFMPDGCGGVVDCGACVPTPVK